MLELMNSYHWDSFFLGPRCQHDQLQYNESKALTHRVRRWFAVSVVILSSVHVSLIPLQLYHVFWGDRRGSRDVVSTVKQTIRSHGHTSASYCQDPCSDGDVESTRVQQTLTDYFTIELCGLLGQPLPVPIQYWPDCPYQKPNPCLPCVTVA